jgi:hypothetical protein
MNRRIKIICNAHHCQSPLDKIGKLWVQWLKTFSLLLYKKMRRQKWATLVQKIGKFVCCPNIELKSVAL